MLCSISRGTKCAAYIVLPIAMAAGAIACSDAARLAPSTAIPGPAAQQTQPSSAPTINAPSPGQSIQPPPGTTAVGAGENTTSEVRILLVHYRGSLQPLGCCNNQLYERDEFVAIQNIGKAAQNMSGWKLVNATRGAPVFTFPVNFPCIPFAPSTEEKYVANTKNYVDKAPQTVEQMFPVSQGVQGEKETLPPIPAQIDWSSCAPIAPLDELPMKPIKGQLPGQTPPCILYPGQIVLIFTDEIHCRYGGLTFSYGLGNLWNNEDPDTAILYNSNAEEVSRKAIVWGDSCKYVTADIQMY